MSLMKGAKASIIDAVGWTNYLGWYEQPYATPEQLDAMVDDGPHHVALDPAAPVLVYCQAGVRSVVAASALRRLGFSNVTSLEGGISGYRERNERSATLA